MGEVRRHRPMQVTMDSPSVVMGAAVVTSLKGSVPIVNWMVTGEVGWT